MDDEDSIDTYTEESTPSKSIITSLSDDNNSDDVINIIDRISLEDDDVDDDYLIDDFFESDYHRELHLFLRNHLRNEQKLLRLTQQHQDRMNNASIHGQFKSNTECNICYSITNVYKRSCCNLEVCLNCLEYYITDKITNAHIKIECLNVKCTNLIHKTEILNVLNSNKELLLKYNQYLIDANKEINKKTCPRCSHILILDKNLFKSKNIKKHPTKVICDKCNLDWCFQCYAPWHVKLTCSKFKKGDLTFKKWAKEYSSGQINARSCPSCKIFIQRSKGCDHMKCTQCNVEFCYKCGEKYKSLKFIGDHHSKYSIFGCKYLLNPDKPFKRKLIRGSLFAGKFFIIAPVLGSVAIIASVVLLGAAVVTLPYFVAQRLIKHCIVSKTKDSLKGFLDLSNLSLKSRPKTSKCWLFYKKVNKRGSGDITNNVEQSDDIISNGNSNETINDDIEPIRFIGIKKAKAHLYRIDESDSEIYI